MSDSIGSSEMVSGARAVEGWSSLEPATLVVGLDSRWVITPCGRRLTLLRYGPARRLFERLVVKRIEEPGIAIAPHDLVEVGWPGEKMQHTAGLLRVYSAVRRLRRLGLTLVTRDDGYLIDPHLPVRRDVGPGL